MTIKKIFIIVCVLALSVLLFACADDVVKKENKKLAESSYKMGLSYFSENNITAALKELVKANQYDPEDVEINHLLGIAYLSKKDYANAEKHLKKALANSKENTPKIDNNLGIVYLEQERYDDAIVQFKKAADDILYDTPEIAYINIGQAYYKKGDIDNAKKSYEKSIEIEPRDSRAYYNLGALYFDLKKYDDAVKEYKIALKFYPNYLDAQYSLALTYFKQSDAEKAKEAFNKVIELAPKDSKQAEESKGYLDTLNK